MADHELIPPVSGNRGIVKTRPLPAKPDKQKHRLPHKPTEPDEKNDDDQTNIDEYA